MSECKSNVTKQFSLKDEEILSRLHEIKDKHEDIVGEIYKTCFDNLHNDVKRTDSLDSKASSLIGALGVSFSIIFALGGVLIKEIDNIVLPVIGNLLPWLVFFYISTSATLLIGLFISLKAVGARSDWRWLNEEDIYNKEVLEQGINDYKIYMSKESNKPTSPKPSNPKPSGGISQTKGAPKPSKGIIKTHNKK